MKYCDAQVQVPAETLAELDALDGTDEVGNPYECLLTAGHEGAHLALGAEIVVSCPDESYAHWVEWAPGAHPVLVRSDFCPEELPTAVPDPGNETQCQLPVRHRGPHLGLGLETAPGEYGSVWW